MAGVDTFEVLGLRDLELNLKKLPKKVAKKILVSASKKAANEFRKGTEIGMRARLIRRTGRLFAGIRVQSKTKFLTKGGAVINVKIGLSPVGASVSREQSVFYGRFLEKGTKTIEPLGFMERAFDSRRDDALRIFQNELRRKIDLVVRGV